jgi:hypothetical protein
VPMEAEILGESSVIRKDIEITTVTGATAAPMREPGGTTGREARIAGLVAMELSNRPFGWADSVP